MQADAALLFHNSCGVSFGASFADPGCDDVGDKGMVINDLLCPLIFATEFSLGAFELETGSEPPEKVPTCNVFMISLAFVECPVLLKAPDASRPLKFIITVLPPGCLLM
mmetsp:Transcript_72514/g.193778  ORF Transcript_72514/g.193778 Transcript_72514/m.193778 type:complete len:109 (-) Transcript_72514:106-432(-)